MTEADRRFYRILGALLKHRRRELGLQRRDLGEVCGVSADVLARMERGGLQHRTREFLVAARTMGLGPGDMLRFCAAEAAVR